MDRCCQACTSEVPCIAHRAVPRNKFEFDIFDNILGGIGEN